MMPREDCFLLAAIIRPSFPFSGVSRSSKSSSRGSLTASESYSWRGVKYISRQDWKSSSESKIQTRDPNRHISPSFTGLGM